MMGTRVGPLRLGEQMNLTHAGAVLPRRRWGAATAGLLVGALAYLLFADARCPAPVTLTLAAVLVTAVPSGRSLSRRVAVNGTAALGLVPLLWMAPALRSVDHGALALALVLGSLLVHVLHAVQPRAALRDLVPDVAPADGLLLVSALAATAWGWHLFAARTRTQAVRALLPGYDHAGHYDIFSMTWSHGAFIGSSGSPADGSAWMYGSYPAGFHAVAASLAQLDAGLRPPGTSAVVIYAHLDAALVVVGTVVVTACLVSALPRPRVLPLLAPLAVLLTALLWLPGGQVLWHGFENFWLAAVLAACSLLLAARAVERRTEALGGIVAVLAAFVGTALNWLPLASIAWVGPVIAVSVWWRGTRDRRGAQVVGLVLCSVAALVVLRTAVALHQSVSVTTLLTSTGGIEASPSAPIAVVGVLLVALTVALGARRSRLADPVSRRVGRVGLGVLSGAVVAGIAVAAQHWSVAGADYYATKLTLGVLVVAGCWLALLLAVVSGRALAPATSHTATGVRALLAVALCAVATQLFGHQSLAQAEFDATRGVGSDDAGRELDYPAMAHGILAAASSVDHDQAFGTQYVAIGASRWYVSTLPDAWFHSLTQTMTLRTNERTRRLNVSLPNAAAAVGPVRQALGADPDLTVLVDPAHVDELRSQLEPRLAARVTRERDRRHTR